MAGMTSTGFVVPTLDELKALLETYEKYLISPTLNTSSASVTGQLNGIFAGEAIKIWEGLKAQYDAMNPDQATGRSLDLICAITGTIRLAATSTVVTAQPTLAAGTYLAGTLVASVAGAPQYRFQNVADVVVAAPSSPNVSFVCQSTGPIPCTAGTLTVIASPVAGWSAITNATDGTPGSDVETDSALRVRREQELTAQGSTTVNSIRSDILRLAQTNATKVISCNILENVTDATDGNGLPPHSIECIVYGPASPSGADNTAVATQIFESKAAGCATYGGTSANVTDSQGYVHAINFTRPTPKNMYVTVTVVGGAAADVKAAIVAYGATLLPGDDVAEAALTKAIMSAAGVSNRSLLKFDTSVTPSNTADYAIALREIASFDTARITVTVT